MIHVFGTVCIDRVLRVPNLPRIGGYVEIEDEVTFLGGEAANTANALHAWGADVYLSGNALGGGPDGDELGRLLAHKGLPSVGLPKGQGRTPICDIYVTPDGERTMFGRGFSDMQAAVDPASLVLQPGEWFTAEPNMGAVAREVARRAAATMKTYLMDFVREDEPIGPGSFWQGSTDWAGERGDMEANRRWADSWTARYGCITILTDGPRGLVVATPEREAKALAAFPARQIVDTTGAGDLFRAGMLFGLDRDWPLARCLAFAAAAGALACETLGATAKVPTVDAIERLIDSRPDIAAQYI